MTRAMILAAGLGTRLGDLSTERPKPLLPVCGVPLIRYVIALLAGHDIRDLVINVHHRGEMIEQELGDGSALGVRIQYSREQTILGTAGGIRRALPLLGDEPFFVVNGKILIDVDLAAVLRTHRQNQAKATLVVRPDADAHSWGAIDAPPSGGRIRNMLSEGDYMFTGIHVLEPSLIKRFADDGKARCIVRDGYVPWLAEGVPLAAHVSGGYFMEHSTPERYLRGNINALRGRARIAHSPAPLSGVDAGVHIAKTAAIHEPVRILAGATIGDGAQVGPDVVVGKNARIGPDVTITRSVVWSGGQVTQDTDRCIITPTATLVVPDLD